MWSPERVPPLRWSGRDIPRGIQLRGMRARKGEPIVVPDRPWEGVIFAPSLIRDLGSYRLWYESVPPDDLATDQAGNRNLLCYAESKDGTNWEKPSLGLVCYKGSEDNNIVYGGSAAKWGYHGGSVFLDTGCGPEERYKIIHLGFLRPQDLDRFRKMGYEVDPRNERAKRPNALFGAISPDGFHWTPLDEPLMLQMSDTQNIAYFDPSLGKYVAYVRTWTMHRRSIGRAESATFRRFPLPETVLWSGSGVGPSDLWYANAKTLYPGTTDYHLMFPKLWRVSEDRFHVHIGVSPDGIMWSLPPRSQVLYPGNPGQRDAGGVDVGSGMVELGTTEVAVPFIAYAIPHKYTRTAPLGSIALARWARGRLVALHAEEQGEFRTMFVHFQGDELHVNVRTLPAGEVRIGVLGRDGNSPKDRSVADCDPVVGDHLDRVVTWHGQSELGHEPGQPMAFRVRMVSAQMFGMHFVES